MVARVFFLKVDKVVKGLLPELGHGVAWHELEGAEVRQFGSRQVGLGNQHEIYR